MIPRWAHRLYAFLFGYFWLPCPECGRPFGGHEWGRGPAYSGVRVTLAGQPPRKALCPRCEPVVAEREWRAFREERRS